MTIGILAYGPRAGLAVFRALQAVERVSTGAIGGYAAFAAFDRNGRLHRAGTQRGGTRTLFVDGETTGVMPRDEISNAMLAGVMSSGPDRPEPLSQFVPAVEGVGLVTGHRLPNAAARSGIPLNIEVMQGLRSGLTPMEAVDRALDCNAQADAGVIAANLLGEVYARNTLRVSRRPDLGHARRQDDASGAIVEVLHNAIFPVESLSALAAEIAMDVMVPRHQRAGVIIVEAGMPLHPGRSNRVFVDPEGRALRVETTDGSILAGTHNCAAVYLESEVLRDGDILGYTLVEPNVVVEGGRIVSLSGQRTCRLPYRSPI